MDIDFVLNNPKMAKEILPTRPEFFFGNLQYNEIYFETLENTKEQLKIILEENACEDIFIYNPWW